MTLHLFNKGLFHQALLERMIACRETDDPVMLLGDGVAWALKGTVLRNTLPDSCLFVRKSDVLLRQLPQNRLDSVQLIDDERFVELAADCSRSLTWF